MSQTVNAIIQGKDGKIEFCDGNWELTCLNKVEKLMTSSSLPQEYYYCKLHIGN